MSTAIKDLTDEKKSREIENEVRDRAVRRLPDAWSAWAAPVLNLFPGLPARDLARPTLSWPSACKALEISLDAFV